MLSKVKTLSGYKLKGLDGEIGKVKGLYFDDLHWTIRYLVADTGNWLLDRQVLISPYALAGVNREARQIEVNLTIKQIEESPPLDSDKPVSLQYERDYYIYYGWPEYWGGSNVWGSFPVIVREPEKSNQFVQDQKGWDPRLRSTQEVSGYHVQAKDGEIGHVNDFIIDDWNTWAIRYLIVDTKNWLPGKKVLVSPKWIDRVDWIERKVYTSLASDAVKRSPEYSEKAILTRDYETVLHMHYNHQGYWVDEPAAK